jgi:hypothetical protein
MTNATNIDWQFLSSGRTEWMLESDLQARIANAIRCLPSGVPAAVYDTPGERLVVPLFMCLPPEGKPMPKLISRHPFKAEFEAIILKDSPGPGLLGFLFMTATPTTPGQTRLYELVFVMPHCMEELQESLISGAIALEEMKESQSRT